ncbi:unnamed protein product [Lota lota]
MPRPDTCRRPPLITSCVVGKLSQAEQPYSASHGFQPEEIKEKLRQYPSGVREYDVELEERVVSAEAWMQGKGLIVRGITGPSATAYDLNAVEPLSNPQLGTRDRGIQFRPPNTWALVKGWGVMKSGIVTSSETATPAGRGRGPQGGPRVGADLRIGIGRDGDGEAPEREETGGPKQAEQKDWMSRYTQGPTQVIPGRQRDGGWGGSVCVGRGESAPDGAQEKPSGRRRRGFGTLSVGGDQQTCGLAGPQDERTR